MRFGEILRPGSCFDREYDYNVDSLIQMTDGLVVCSLGLRSDIPGSNLGKSFLILIAKCMHSFV